MEDWRITTLDGPEMSDERLIEVMEKAAEEYARKHNDESAAGDH